MQTLKSRLKKLEQNLISGNVYIFRPQQKGLKGVTREQLLTMEGTWSSAKGRLSKAPKLNQNDHVIIDNIL